MKFGKIFIYLTIFNDDDTMNKRKLLRNFSTSIHFHTFFCLIDTKFILNVNVMKIDINRSSLSRFVISRRLIHAGYKQFYIREKSESLKIKIKSNDSKFADDSNAKSFKCVKMLFKTRKKMKKNEKK
jgi:hypothetical protein